MKRTLLFLVAVIAVLLPGAAWARLVGNHNQTRL